MECIDEKHGAFDKAECEAFKVMRPISGCKRNTTVYYGTDCVDRFFLALSKRCALLRAAHQKYAMKLTCSKLKCLPNVAVAALQMAKSLIKHADSDDESMKACKRLYKTYEGYLNLTQKNYKVILCIRTMEVSTMTTY